MSAPVAVTSTCTPAEIEQLKDVTLSIQPDAIFSTAVGPAAKKTLARWHVTAPEEVSRLFSPVLSRGNRSVLTEPYLFTRSGCDDDGVAGMSGSFVSGFPFAFTDDLSFLSFYSALFHIPRHALGSFGMPCVPLVPLWGSVAPLGHVEARSDRRRERENTKAHLPLPRSSLGQQSGASGSISPGRKRSMSRLTRRAFGSSAK